MRRGLLFTAAAVVVSMLFLFGCKADKTKQSDNESQIQDTGLYEYELENMEREVINFNTDWLYAPADYKNGEAVDLDDSEFEAVSLPHANKIIEKHKGPEFEKEIESYRFVSWYRRHFEIDESYLDKRVFVEFEGVATVADVYVNGEYVDTHKGAYTGFTVDITDYIHEGANVLAVRVDSERQTEVPPEGGNVDYCLFGGIVRDVNMIVTSPAYISNTFITTPELSAESGKAAFEVTVNNLYDTEKTLSVTSEILDNDGTVVAEFSDEHSVAPNSEVVFESVSDAILSPNLWSTDDPYLYTVRVTLSEGDATIDSVVSRLGFRWFSFEDDGLYLNGEWIEIVGVNRHEQWPWIGRAVSNRQQAADADLIKETGFNAVRCSHYPQDPAFLDRCDEIGLIVFEEAPGWQYIGGDEWREVYKENIEEMILRDRNHPSILSWGTRVNESFDCDELYLETNDIAKELDPTRPTHGVRRAESYADTNFLENEDIFCANYQYPDFPRFRPFIIAEHSNDWFSGHGFPDASDTDALAFTNSFASAVDYYFGNELCIGGFAWSMFDYNNEVNYTGTDNLFYSGLYSIYRIPKMAAHFYRSQKEPIGDDAMVYIANYRTENSPKDVTVFSNCDEVELFAGGKSVGKITPNTYMNLPHPMYTFKDVPQDGDLKAVGYIDGKKVAEQTVKAPEDPYEIILKPQFDTITADGAEFTSVEIYLVDKNGTVLPYADNVVTINVSGAGKFIGEKEIALEGGTAAFFIQSLYNETGIVTAEVSADGLESVTCEIEAVSFDEKTVPVAESEGTQTLLMQQYTDYNDSDAIFEYSVGWTSCDQGGCYMNDNTYSNAAGATLTVKFTGDRLVWYGSTAPSHGIMILNLDGEEQEIDCYSEERRDSVVIFDSGEIENTEHTLTVTVTGRENDLATDRFINVDRVRVYQTK